MQEQLLRINAVGGVSGSFVCDEEGEVLASALAPEYDGHRLYLVTRTVAQTLAGLRTVQKRRPGNLDMLYANGRLLVKPLVGGCLCILCSARVNVPLLNLTADVVVRKLASQVRGSRPQASKNTPAEPLPEARTPTEPTEQILKTLDQFLRPFGK